MNLESLKKLPPAKAQAEFLKCCGSLRWAEAMVELRAHAVTVGGLTLLANEMWWSLDQDDWLEAFRSHPKIGEKKAAQPLSMQSKEWSGQEQSSMREADQDTVDDLARLNREYEKKFGFIFIVCATGKSAADMLDILRDRISNEPEVELPIAAAEQAKITELRLKKLIN
jgi:2-oxo-4-hydroxy-4-carboxy-5-ureidoimidazoline decarboxylase